MNKVIKLVGNGKVHLVNGEAGTRLTHIEFIQLIHNLRKRLPFNSLEWDIYPGQPVYEFGYDRETVSKAIKMIDTSIEVKYV